MEQKTTTINENASAEGVLTVTLTRHGETPVPDTVQIIPNAPTGLIWELEAALRDDGHTVVVVQEQI